MSRQDSHQQNQAPFTDELIFKLPLGLAQTLQRWHWGANLSLIATISVFTAALNMILIGGLIGSLLSLLSVVPIYLSLAAETQLPSPPERKPWINPNTTFKVNMVVSTLVGLWLIITGLRQADLWGYASSLLGAVLIVLILMLQSAHRKN